MASWKNNTKLVIATEHNPKNPYHNKINKLLVDSGLDIHWTGYLSDEKVSHLLQISDLVVLPFDSPISTRRGSMIAAIGHGCCVVTTGPSEEIFVHQQNCYLMKDNSAKNISESINYLFKNESLLNKIKLEAKKTSKLFDWGIIAQEHDKKYKRIHK
jgi:glycosyltransferase involved in cell wall biosynthesis